MTVWAFLLKRSFTSESASPEFLELFDRSFHSECHLVILLVEQVAVYTRRQVEHLRNFIVQLSNLGGFLEFKEFLMQLEKHILVDFVKMSLTIIPK